MLRDTPGEVLVCCDLSYYRASRGLRLTGELCPPARQRRSPEGGLLSSAILYVAIVVIWAGVLIPRWLRRDSSDTAAAAAERAEAEAAAALEFAAGSAAGAGPGSGLGSGPADLGDSGVEPARGP